MAESPRWMCPSWLSQLWPRLAQAAWYTKVERGQSSPQWDHVWPLLVAQIPKVGEYVCSRWDHLWPLLVAQVPKVEEYV